MYVVKFRGENVFDADATQPDPGVGEMREWRPKNAQGFECGAVEARARYDELVRAGMGGAAVDGVVPYVVEIAEVEYSTCEGEERRLTSTLLWQYAEAGAELMGPWAEFEPSGHCVAA
jgi:hypothetical protein